MPPGIGIDELWFSSCCWSDRVFPTFLRNNLGGLPASSGSGLFGELEILFACQLAKDTGEYPRSLVFFSYNSEQCVMQILLAAPDSVVI